MNNRKNHNSVLILATLGVYLGLVLVGATPQVLAQAAMTRQFNVKDEVEVKDDLDKKPDPTPISEATDRDSETTKQITSSVRKFLAKFQSAGSLDSIAAASADVRPIEISFNAARPSSDPKIREIGVHLDQILAITNFARGSLDSLFANAK